MYVHSIDILWRTRYGDTFVHVLFYPTMRKLKSYDFNCLYVCVFFCFLSEPELLNRFSHMRRRWICLDCFVLNAILRPGHIMKIRIE